MNSETVTFVIDHLHAAGFSSTQEIDLLKKTVKPFEDRVRSRVTALKVLVGSFWGGFVYYFSKTTETAMSNAAQFLTQFWILFGMLGAVFVTFLCVWGYEAAIEKLFRAIEFGCNDFCLTISTEKSDVLNEEKISS